MDSSLCFVFSALRLCRLLPRALGEQNGREKSLARPFVYNMQNKKKMNDLTYYTKAINDCRETQCQSDLLNGKIKIADVPFAFRGHDEYAAAHKYARGLVDEKERYYLYWKVLKIQLVHYFQFKNPVVQIKEYGRTHAQLSEEIPEEDEFFNIDNRELDLTEAHRFYFEFATRKL